MAHRTVLVFLSATSLTVLIESFASIFSLIISPFCYKSKEFSQIDKEYTTLYPPNRKDYDYNDASFSTPLEEVRSSNAEMLYSSHP